MPVLRKQWPTNGIFKEIQMEINDNAEKLLEFCEVIDLDEESAAKAMAIACATLAGNESNLLNLVSMMIQAFQIINE
jgi:hypothetical protein